MLEGYHYSSAAEFLLGEQSLPGEISSLLQCSNYFFPSFLRESRIPELGFENESVGSDEVVGLDEVPTPSTWCKCEHVGWSLVPHGFICPEAPAGCGTNCGAHLAGSVRRIRSTGMLHGFRLSGRRCCLLVPARPLQRRIKDLLWPSLTHLHQCLRGRPVLSPNYSVVGHSHNVHA